MEISTGTIPIEWELKSTVQFSRPNHERNMDARAQAQDFHIEDGASLRTEIRRQRDSTFFKSAPTIQILRRKRAQGRYARKIQSASHSELQTIERQIQVAFLHRIFFTHGVFCPSNTLLRNVLIGTEPHRVQRVFIILDAGLARARPQVLTLISGYFEAHSSCLELVSSPLRIPGGEQAKNSPNYLAKIHSQINRYALDRHSYVMAVGGGALLDLAGFAAATAHRGLRQVRLPTTTLSQNDSGVGVKNGINAFGKKNFLGTFAPPFAVINDFDLLRSLLPREKRAGYAEAVKVALIRDAAFFETIEQQADQLREFAPDILEWLIYRCAELHVSHIATSGDPFEFGSFRPLDFGHWSAHKLEQLSKYRIGHGEAVAIGIALDTVYSRLAGLLDAGAADRILGLLEKLGFELFAEELLHRNAKAGLEILDGLEEFRQHLGGELAISLLEDIGRQREVHTMRTPLILSAIRELESRHKRL